MDKYVLTVFLTDEAISLLFTKPLYRPLCQSSNLLSKITSYAPNAQVATLTKGNHP